MTSLPSSLDSPLSLLDDLSPRAFSQLLDDITGDVGPAAPPSIDDAMDSTRQSSHKQPKKRNYDPNKARSEQRRELQRLRVEVGDLELKREQLEAGRGNGSCPKRNLERDAALPLVWEAICARQFERRLKAEQENKRLRKRHKAELKLIRGIEKLLYRRLSLQNFVAKGGRCFRRVEIPTGFVQHLADRIFQELETGVDVAYRDVERVLAFPTAETQEPLLRDGVSIELFDRRSLPFDLHATSNAWWRRWQNYRGQYSPEDTDDVVNERYGLQMLDANTDKAATFYVQQVLRRHVEEDRVVVVWHAYIEPFTFDETRIYGAHFLVRGYVLMKPVERDSDAGGESGGAVTRVVTCYSITPQFSDPKLRKNSKTNTLTKFVVSATAANISVTNDMMENLLVDEALQKCS
ncbi:hypothetical protein PHMEG_00011152 [Phytophthora megakarya]|uniref:M96 mating-specific protein n=1 Tax=Phytophthora megakarya TaxID=4795 RepID=A0A225WC97_9STRA|nr:hypothetical protein PHMEG_00011152 [Phytophthora megakarya]